MVSTFPSFNTSIAYSLDLKQILTGSEWAREQMDDEWETENCGKQQVELEVEDRQQILELLFTSVGVSIHLGSSAVCRVRRVLVIAFTSRPFFKSLRNSLYLNI